MPKESDKLQREIEELLDNLDTFVPEDRLAEKIKLKKKQDRQQERAVRAAQRGPTPLDQVWRRVSQITLGHVMIAGIALLLIGVLFDDALGAWSRWVTIGAIVLTFGAFILSAMNKGTGSKTTLGGKRTQKVWRGQVIEYSEPAPVSGWRNWLRRRTGR